MPFTKSERSPAKQLPSNIYRHINECPLAVFIDCSIDSRYKSLIKYGTARQVHLEAAWSQIYSEYSEHTGSDSYRLLMNLSRQIGYEETKLLCIGLCLRVMYHRPEEKCIKILRNYGYNYAYDIRDKQQYIKDLEAVAKRTGGLQLSIDQKRKELSEREKSIGGKEMTREMFDDMIAELAKHMAFRIDKHEVTVSEFISYRKHYEKTAEYYEKQRQKIKK